MGDSTAQRPEQLGNVLADHGVSAYLAHSPFTMGFLTSFNEGAAERFLTLAFSPKGGVRLIGPALSVNQATRHGIDDVRGLKDGESPEHHLKELAKDWGINGKVAVDDEMPAAVLLTLQNIFPDIQFVPGSMLLAELTRWKTTDELEKLFRAGGIADNAFTEVAPKIKAGMTELDVNDMLQASMASQGGKPMFAIVAAAANGAEPHHMTDDTVLEEGQVVICDFGCTVDGYYSDITRTVCIGEPNDVQEHVYCTVYEAHMAARAVIRPGVKAGEIDAAARNVIEAAGYGEFFTHRTGHGLGTRIHEEPYIVAGSEVELKVGDCFSIEPGIYLPGRFGVRLENIVTVSEDGHRSFNADPPSTMPIVG